MLTRHRALALLLLVVPLTTAANAGVVPFSRETLIDIAGQITGDSFDTQDALTTFGPYDNTISDSLSPTSGGTTTASASQQSNVTAAAFSGFARGSANAQVAELDAIAASASSQFVMIFNVTDQPETISLQGRVSSTFDASARVIIDNQANAAEILFSRVVDVGTEDELTFDEDVLLQPGTYRMIADGSVNGTPVPGAAEYEVNFSVDSDGGTVIPLPAGVWPGAIMLAGAALWVRRSH